MTEVLFPTKVLESLRSHYEATKFRGEAGGLLLGYRKDGAIQIDIATFPKRWDRATSWSFFRSDRGHRIAALREWKRSDKTMDWVGEWHTHPFGSQQPSGTDRRNWSKVFAHTKNPMAFVIIGASETYVGLQLDRGAVAPMRKSQVETDWILFR